MPVSFGMGEGSAQSAKRWILLRGLTRESGHWGSFADEFRQQMAPAPVLLLDLPGTGKRLSEDSPLTMDKLVDAVRTQIGESLRQNLALVGMSLGGMLACEWLRRFPQEVDLVVAMNISAKDSSPFWRRMQPLAVKTLAKALVTTSSRAREESLVQLVARNEARWPELTRLWTQIAEGRPVSRLTFARQMAAATQFQAQPKPPSKGLLLAGLGDRLVDPECTKTLAEAWSWPARYHPWAGHELSADDPTWVLKEIQAFAQNLPT